MTTIQFAIKPDMSKQEEIDLLNKLFTCVHSEQTYLADLINGNLVSWATQQIHDDGCTDIYDTWCVTEKENTMLQQHLNDEQKLNTTLKVEVTDLRSAMDQRLEQISTLSDELKDERSSHEHLSEIQIGIADELRDQLKAHDAQATYALTQRDQTIIELKARLLDALDQITALNIASR